MQLPVGEPGGISVSFYRWAVDVVMGCKTRAISSGFQSSWGDWMIRYEKWRFDDRRFGGFTTQSEEKTRAFFHLNKGDMGEKRGGQTGQTQQWGLPSGELT